MAQPSPKSPATEVYRYERKYHALGLDLSAVEALLRVHPAAFRRAYPPRWINNLYFDSPTLADYCAHVNGMANRRKVRVRWYGALDPDGAGRLPRPVLELKTRRGTVGTKPSFPLRPTTVEELLARGGALGAAVDSDVPLDVRELLARSVPALFNRYHRRYLLSADERFRLTIDTDLEFTAARPLGPRRHHRARGLIVLELKYAAADDPDAGLVASRFPFRLDKLSKYVHGIQAVTGIGE
ncbi:MAG: polyphosphate polymerase domain-containing protein [Planctomycetota bacterium]|jgi:hypothetical protein|nr:polyphosphate polymerase domain-containing protein [Planctomycetota bacterium]MDP6761654.1 polyphosphate polymerase domain-containing protein [Planctomycetota bacterium]MDP6990165.1 polyphosphate polymerase domain-containing protein [Planctomycetota bacterium]